MLLHFLFYTHFLVFIESSINVSSNGEKNSTYSNLDSGWFELLVGPITLIEIDCPEVLLESSKSLIFRHNFRISSKTEAKLQRVTIKISKNSTLNFTNGSEVVFANLEFFFQGDSMGDYVFFQETGSSLAFVNCSFTGFQTKSSIFLSGGNLEFSAGSCIENLQIKAAFSYFIVMATKLAYLNISQTKVLNISGGLPNNTLIKCLGCKGAALADVNITSARWMSIFESTNAEEVVLRKILIEASDLEFFCASEDAKNGAGGFIVSNMTARTSYFYKELFFLAGAANANFSFINCFKSSLARQAFFVKSAEKFTLSSSNFENNEIAIFAVYLDVGLLLFERVSLVKSFLVFPLRQLVYEALVHIINSSSASFFDSELKQNNFFSSAFSVTNQSSNFTLFNCSFRENYRSMRSKNPLMISFDSPASLFILSSEFIGNYLDVEGATVILLSTNPLTATIIEKCLFVENKGTKCCNFISFFGLFLNVTMISFKRNINAEGYNLGGGIIFSGSRLSINHSEFSENFSPYSAVLMFRKVAGLVSQHAVVENCIFKSNRGEKFIFKIVTSLGFQMNFTNCFFSKNFLSKTGIFGVSLSALKEDPFFIKFFLNHFENNEASRGPIFYLDAENGHLLIDKTIFLNNKAHKFGGVIFTWAFLSTLLTTRNCLFMKNSANRAAVLFLLVIVYRDFGSLFISNSANYSSTLEASTGTLSFLTNTVIFKAEALVSNNINTNSYTRFEGFGVVVAFCKSRTSGAFLTFFRKSTVVCYRCLTFKNSARKDTLVLGDEPKSFTVIRSHFLMDSSENAVFTLRDSSFCLLNSIIYNCRGQQLSFMHMKTQILRTIIYGASASGKTKGFLISSDRNSVLNIETAYFISIQSESNGIAALSIIDSSAVFSDLFLWATLRNALGSFSSVIRSSVGLMKSSIFITSASMILSSESRINIFKTVMAAPIKDGKQISFVKVVNNKMVNIQNSSFFGATNTALICEGAEGESGRVNLLYNTFLGCQGAQGGAITIIKTNFFALGIIFQNNNALLNGGCLSLSCERLKRCNWTVAFSSFLSNTAGWGGGAIYWETSLPVSLANNFSNNTAKYGADLASFPIKFFQESESNEQFKKFSPGSILSQPLVFTVRDFYDNVVKTISGARANINMRSASPTEPLDFVDDDLTFHSIIGNDFALVNEGTFSFSNIKILSEPKSSRIMVISCEKVSSYLFDTGYFNQSSLKPMIAKFNYVFMINISFSNCPEGSIYKKELRSCLQCPSDYYTFSATEAVCKPCPLNAKCSNGYQISVDRGYWRSSNKTVSIYKCINSLACMGGAGDNLCQEGFVGLLCGACVGDRRDDSSLRYFLDVDKVCKPCDSTQRIRAMLIVSLVLVVSLIYVTLVIRDKILSSHNLKSVLLKIFTEYVQISSLILGVEIDWPLKIDNIFNYNINFSKPENFLTSFECILDNYFSSDWNIFFKQQLVIILFAVATPFITFLFWLVFGFFRKMKKAVIQENISITFVVLFYTYQPSLLSTAFKTLFCKEINGSYYLHYYLNQECWTPTHFSFLFYFIFPYLSIIMIILPLYYLVKVYLDHARNENKKSLEFFVGCYRRKFFFWDFGLVGKKYILILIITFIKDKNLICVIFLIVYFLFFFLHIKFKAFKNSRARTIATKGKVAIFSSLFYFCAKTQNPVFTFNVIFALLLLLFNAYFLLAYFIIYHSMNKNFMILLQKIKILRKIISPFYIDCKTGEKTFFDPNKEVLRNPLKKLTDRMAQMVSSLRSERIALMISSIRSNSRLFTFTEKRS